nr:unnamed protein product [Digitaria exilis]
MGGTRPSVALEAIFRSLPQRSLAACRCVCRKWLTIIDARRLLRRDLLPFSMGGIFITLGFSAQAPPAFFARPSSSSSSAIAAGRDLDSYALETNSPGLVRILDCCNGLLLLRNRVVNPATWQWARVPPPCHVAWADNGGYGAIGDAYLVYDPSTSPDSFEVVLIQDASFLEDELEDGSECPPPSYTMSIYSSAAAATAAGARQGRWEERTFVRDGEPAGTFGAQTLVL